MLALQRRWRALSALTLVGGSLLTLPALAVSAGTLRDNVTLLVHFQNVGEASVVKAETMSNWRGFVVSLTGRGDVWLWLPGMALIALVAAGVCVRIWWRASAGSTSHSNRAAASLEQSYALAVMLPLVVSPHLHTQSLMLIFIPAALALRSMFPDSRAIRDRAVEASVVARLLALHAALFALWFIGVQSVMPLVFLVLYVGWLTAFRWPSAASASDGGSR